MHTAHLTQTHRHPTSYYTDNPLRTYTDTSLCTCTPAPHHTHAHRYPISYTRKDTDTHFTHVHRHSTSHKHSDILPHINTETPHLTRIQTPTAIYTCAHMHTSPYLTHVCIETLYHFIFAHTPHLTYLHKHPTSHIYKNLPLPLIHRHPISHTQIPNLTKAF